MIRAMMVIIAASRRSADADAEALIAAILGDGGSLTSDELSAIRYFIPYLKSKSIWSQIKALYLMVGGDAIGCKYNAKDPRDLDAAFRLVFYNSPTFDGNGVQWDGSSTYAETFCAIDPDLDINSLHLSYYSRQNTSSSGVELGAFSSSVFYMQIYYSPLGKSSWSYPSGDEILQSAPSSLGAFTGSRQDSSHSSIYQGNTLIGTSGTTSTALISTTVHLGHANELAGFYTDRQCAGASIGLGLTDQNILDLNAGWQIFNTMLGRQV